MTANWCDLSGKTILVTGASSGLGRGIAVALAQAGAKLVLLARDPARLEQTRTLCGGEPVVWPADLTADLDAVPALVRSVCEKVGPLSGLVHSAGKYQTLPLRALGRTHMESLFQVNTAAAIMLVKGLSATGNYLPGASAVILSSVLGPVGKPATTSYGMTKLAVEIAVKAMALELVRQQIRVNCLAPGLTPTPLTEEFLRSIGPEAAAKFQKEWPSGYGRLEDAAAGALFLLSDASRYMTGTTLLMDGGYRAQ